MKTKDTLATMITEKYKISKETAECIVDDIEEHTAEAQKAQVDALVKLHIIGIEVQKAQVDALTELYMKAAEARKALADTLAELHVKAAEAKVDVLVDVLAEFYMRNAKTGKERSGGDPFWDKAERAFITSLIYYIREEDEALLKEGFTIAERDENGKPITAQAMKNGRHFSTILKLVQEAKALALTSRFEDFFKRVPNNKTRLYYDTFLITPKEITDAILNTMAIDLQTFFAKESDLPLVFER